MSLGFQRAKVSLISLLFFFSTSLALATAPQSGITYHGRIIKPDGLPLETQVQFRLQIRSIGSENCLLYEEIHSEDLTETGGVFAVTLNDGEGSRTDSTGYTLDQVFGNRGSYTVPTTTCVSGTGGTTTWAPSAADGRRLQVHFKDSTMNEWEPMPAQTVDYVPLALESKNIGGFPAASLLRVEEAAGPQNVAALSQANYDELMDIILGTSTQYAKDTDIKGFAKANLPVCGAGEFLKSGAGNTWSCVAAAAGSSADAADLTTGTLDAARLPATVLLNGGNTVTGTTTIGTNSNHSFAIETNGTTRMTVLNDGKVGFGTTTPSNVLTVDGNASIVNGSLGLNRNPNDGSVPTGGNAAGGRYQLTPHANYLNISAFDTSGANVGNVAIDATTGNVGIGTTAPLTGYKLDVRGDLKIGSGAGGETAILTGSTQNHGDFIIRQGTDGAPNETSIRMNEGNSGRLDFYSKGTSAPSISINGSGNSGHVGIGTTAPTEKLTVAGNIAFPDTGGAGTYSLGISGWDDVLSVKLSRGAIVSSTDPNQLDYEVHARHVFKIGGMAATEKTALTLTGDYKVILGPLGGTADAGSVTRTLTTTSGQSPANSDNLVITTGDAAYGTHSGSISIYPGLPSNNFDIVGPDVTIKGGVSTGTANGGSIIFETTPAGGVSGNTQNTYISAMKIESSGNVGVGTPTPAAKLDVDGDVKVGNSAAACNGTTEGSQRYNSISKKMEFCNGTAWGPIGGFSSCTTVSSGTGTATCAAGYTLTGGGCSTGANGSLFQVLSEPSGNSWTCQWSSSALWPAYASGTASAVCCQ